MTTERAKDVSMPANGITLVHVTPTVTHAHPPAAKTANRWFLQNKTNNNNKSERL